MKKKLTYQEIEDSVNKIRQKYDDYIIKYLKPIKIKDSFEERYIDALRARVDMSLFLNAEISVLTELNRREEKKIRNLEENKKNKEKTHNKKENIAEKVLAKHKKQIEKYPEIQIHKGASSELRKIFGILSKFEREFWPDIDRLLRDFSTIRYSGIRQLFESKIINLCSINTHGFPPRLSRYCALLSRIPMDYKEIAIEEKRCLLDCAFLLHPLYDELMKIRAAEGVQEEDLTFINEALDILKSIISDFRLKEFKK